ncbi:tripartite tricarboxylate transporter permease, partial [Roseicyclus sp.]|uniref:tripartite tricarboxylate transporter permease n=1 Tax=Roseicyclus sp. TaxID=1914329 RepID=UPI003F6BEA0C
LLGMSPGPAMIRQDLDITYTIVWSLALANVVGAGLCVLLSGQIAKLTTIRFTLLAPFLFMLIAFAAFQSRMSFGDLIALVFVGIIGILLRRFDYSRPAFLIGFVLSTQAEQFVNMATQIGASRFRRSFEAGIDYLVSPITVTLLILTVLSIVIGIRQAKNIRENIATHTGTKRAPMLFLGAITLYVAIATIDASTVTRFGDKVFPLSVGIVTLIGCLALMARMILRPEADDVFIDMETGGDDGKATHSLWGTLAWFLGLLVLTGLFGFIIALAIFMLAFFRIRAQVSWTHTLLLSALAIVLICGLAWVLNRDFPPGLLQEVVRLPWPLR